MRSTIALTMAVLAAVLTGCTDKPGNATESNGTGGTSTSVQAVAANNSVAKVTKAQVPTGPWGTIKGQIVFGGDSVPANPKLTVDKDMDHCLSKGPLHAETWVVNDKNKGLRNVMVHLKFEEGKAPALPDATKATLPKEVVVDQPVCAFEPHVFGMTKDQALVAKNSGEKGHNITITSFIVGSHNIQIPAGKEHRFTWDKGGYIASPLTCGAHPWMKGFMFVFDHPYFAVTDVNGFFEIKIAPAGKQRMVVWHEGIGWLGGAAGKDGREVEVKQGEVLDLGKIELKPKS